MSRTAAFLLPSLAALLLAGCGGAAKDTPAPVPDDAAVIDALSDPIMTDPDLTAQNQAHAAIAVSGPISSALPPVDRSQDAIAAAKDAAALLLSGANVALPDPVAADLKSLRGAVTAAQMALAANVPGAACAGRADYTARWAAQLPEPFQVYPRGAVEEAAGSDAQGCRLRIVHFSTPVAVEDVLAFYHARLRAAGYAVQHGADGGDHVLRGAKGAAGYAIYLRQAADGLTAADIIVGGA